MCLLLTELTSPQALKTAGIKPSLVLAPSHDIPNKPFAAALTLGVGPFQSLGYS